MWGTAPPEPFASEVDVWTAAQHLERAIHAPSASAARFWLLRAEAQIDHAAVYQQTYGQIPLADRARQVASALHQLAHATGLQSAQALPVWQAGPLYAFQGVLSALATALQRGG